MTGALAMLVAGGGRGEEFGKSSPMGLVVIVLLAIAVVFLIRSMNKHLRGLPETFDEPPADRADRAGEPARDDAREQSPDREHPDRPV